MTRLLAPALGLAALALSACTVPGTAVTRDRTGPPASYTQHVWTDPGSGCSYIRAQAPGYAPTWHLIINGSRIGLNNASNSCPGYLASQGG
ncbi:hypothetical protein ACXN5S_00880 [Pseudoroseicyclus sp. H15]